MAKQTIVWTALPNGRAPDGPFAGQLRVTIIASPRLTPQTSNENVLKAFDAWRDWPRTLDNADFSLILDGRTETLTRVSAPDHALWGQLFTDKTPVAGFQFKDMSQVNLRSFPVRNVISLARHFYGRLAVQSASTHPTLLPWQDAHPDLKDMLAECGTRTQRRGLGRDQSLLPGFDRLMGGADGGSTDKRLRGLIFGPESRYRVDRAGIDVDENGNPRSGGEFPIRVLPPDWHQLGLGEPDDELMSIWNTAAEYTLYQANRFYQRGQPTAEQSAMRRPVLAGIPASPEAPEYDFHRMIASYGDYPELLRRLGLVLDYVLPKDSLIDRQVAAASQAQGMMAVKMRWRRKPAGVEHACLRTAWQADSSFFTTRARSQDHERGMLQLRGANDRCLPWGKQRHTQFDVHQVDPDGTALKTVDFVLSAQNLVGKSLAAGAHGEVTYTTGNKQALAALRSGGLGVSRHGRAAQVAQNAAAAALKDAAIKAGAATARNVALFAEDVLRGYRIDVQSVLPDGSGPWHSLCQRQGEYRLIKTGQVLDLAADEGYVKGASTTSASEGGQGDTHPDDYYLHETMFRWTGWSLAAPRPGRTLRSRDDPASGVQTETPERVSDEYTEAGNHLAVDFRPVKGSLPKLRYGASYRFRARLVDLAGNSLKLDDPALKEGGSPTEPVTYWRFEPIDPPALLHRTRVSEGESLERLVIRSNWDTSAGDYLQTAAFSAASALPASSDFEYAAVNERHVVPPKSSQLQCETHGLFDSLLNNPSDIRKAYEIAARDAYSLYDATPSSQIELITPAALKQVATTTQLPPRLPTSDNPTGDRLAPGQYVIHRQAAVETPYLPDGAAGGFALRASRGHTLPGVHGPVVLGPNAMVVAVPSSDDLVLLVSYGKGWPDTSGLRIVLAEHASTLQDPPCTEAFSDAGLPKWDEKTRTLTLFVPKGRIVRLRYSCFAAPLFLPTFGLADWVDSEGERNFIQEMAALGCHWMITPYRPLVLVHATQQPVCAPVLLKLTAQREAGAMHADLRAQIRLHGPSTGKVEVEALWKEWVDDVDQPGPRLQPAQGALGEVLLAENHSNLFSLSAAVDAQTPEGADGKRARGDRHEFGDAKFRLIQYRLRATTRFREYLPAALYEQRDEVTRLGPVAEGPRVSIGADDDPGAPELSGTTGSAPYTAVLASMPPDVPRLLYIVPTFSWKEDVSDNGLDVSRLGNGLRVWLGRPWFSSGNGELLGVVIGGDKQRFTDIDNEMTPLVTQWGLDPLWDTNLPKHQGSVADFPACVAHETVALQENNRTVHVVGHRVCWDAGRALWYCDIELDAGTSYMPFVRLALVRYQPNAIHSAKVSRVVLSDFAQLLPWRRATFQRSGTELSFTLRGAAPQHGPMKFPLDSEYQDVSFAPFPGSQGETGRNKIELVLQSQDPSINSDLAWSDVTVLASGLTGTDSGATALSPSLLGSLPTARPPIRAVVVPTALKVGNAKIDVNTGLRPPAGVSELGALLNPAPAMWAAKVTLPATPGRAARVAVREYERYYTDQTLPEVRGGATHKRRVVEERLVYSSFFELKAK